MLNKYSTPDSKRGFAFILNARNLEPPFLSIFFWIKIDDFKNRCSLVFMPVQRNIVVEKCTSGFKHQNQSFDIPIIVILFLFFCVI